MPPVSFMLCASAILCNGFRVQSQKIVIWSTFQIWRSDLFMLATSDSNCKLWSQPNRVICRTKTQKALDGTTLLLQTAKMDREPIAMGIATTGTSLARYYINQIPGDLVYVTQCNSLHERKCSRIKCRYRCSRTFYSMNSFWAWSLYLSWKIIQIQGRICIRNEVFLLNFPQICFCNGN